MNKGVEVYQLIPGADISWSQIGDMDSTKNCSMETG